MRDLMNEATVVPPWLHDTFLGYGDPAAAQYLKLPDFVRTVDFKVPLWLAVGAAQLGETPGALLPLTMVVCACLLGRSSAEEIYCQLSHLV